MNERWERLTVLWGRMYNLRQARRAEVGFCIEKSLPLPEHDLAIARALSDRMDVVNAAAVAAAEAVAS